jgi:3-oxoacyl-[acyl-carrier protein] reductase
MAAQFDLRGKVAIVTGAGSGIGRATAIALARNGAAVAINYHKNEQGAAETLAEIQAMRRNALMVRADVTVRAEVAQMIVDTLDNFGGIDILVNNAGSIVKLMRIEECSDEVWDAVMDVNLKSVFLCSQIALPYLKQHHQHLVAGGATRRARRIAAIRGGEGGGQRFHQRPGQ